MNGFCKSIKDKYNILNMTTTFLSAILTEVEPKGLKGDKSQLLKRLEQVYQSSLKRLAQQHQQKGVIQLCQQYFQQVKEVVSEHSGGSLSPCLNVENSRVKSISEDLNGQQQLDPAIQQQQSEYMFLRNAWHSKYQPNQGYDVEDHIDRINKAVAMVRMRTNYMIKKETYLHEKEESLNSYILENPIFMKMKEELEKMTMWNEELSQRCHFQAETIARLESQKSTLLDNFTNMKKKFQQMQKSFIEISKKNICLQQDSLALKSQNSKNKLNSMRESTDFIANMDLRRSTSFSRFAEQAKMTERSTEPSQGTIKPSLLPLENVFVDISLNLNSSRQPTKQPKTTNNRYANNDSENQENTSVNGGRQRTGAQNQNVQILALCRSQRLITEQSPMRLRYIRNNDNSSARKTLLSSARSVDLADKTSLNKPKFQRTKPNYQNLLRSVKKDDCILETRVQRPSLLKKLNILNDGSGSTKAFRNFHDTGLQREEIN